MDYNAPLTPESRAAMLEFEAPYVIWKLQLIRNVTGEEEARLLFFEMKRYLLVIDAVYPQQVPTFSRRVDEAWHQFVLFTSQYTEFCERFFGRYMHHRPGYWLESTEHESMAFEEFAATYAALFGERPPALWHDDHALRLDDRLRFERFDARFEVREVDERAELLVVDGASAEVIARVDAWGAPALRFIAAHPCFYIRELPGLDDEDRLALAHALMSSWEFCLTF